MRRYEDSECSTPPFWNGPSDQPELFVPRPWECPLRFLTSDEDKGVLGPPEALQQGFQPQGPGNLGLPEALPARRVPGVLGRHVGRDHRGQRGRQKGRGHRENARDRRGELAWRAACGACNKFRVAHAMGVDGGRA